MSKSIRVMKSGLTRTFVASLSAACALLVVGGQPAMAATFAEPQALSPDSGFRSEFPVVAIAPDGAANVAWRQYVDPPPPDSHDDSTIGSVFVDSSGAADPAVDFGDGFSPATVVDADGTTTLAWIERNEDDSERFVRFVRIDSNGNAGPIETATQSTGFLIDLRAAIDSEGRVTLAWTDTKGQPGEDHIERIMAARLSSSGVAGTPFQVSKSKKSLGSFVVSVDTKDRVVLAWTAWNTDDTSFRISVRAAVVPSDGGSQPASTVIPSEKGEEFYSLGLSGRRLLAYHSKEKKRSGETKRSLLLASLKKSAEPSTVSKIAKDRDNPAFNAQIETNPDGTSVIVFDSFDNSIKSIAVNGNGKASKPTTIAKGAVRGVDLAMGGNGKAVACWKVVRETIALAQFNRHGKPGKSELGVERPTVVARPIVAIDGGGRITLVWEEDGQIFLANEAS